MIATKRKKIKFSCVVDNKPKFIIQSIIWLYTLLKTQSADLNSIVLHVIKNVEKEYFDFLNELGVEAYQMESFGTGNAAYCNKLVQLNSPAFRDTDTIVLCDTDIAFASNVKETILNAESVQAKVVDWSLPPFAILEEMKKRSGIVQKPKIVRPDFKQDDFTYSTNCNGGFYIIPEKYFTELKEPWLKWSNWCLQQKTLLQEFTLHSDQLGFCFSLLETGIPLEHLPRSMNFPTHFKKDLIQSKKTQRAPLVLHYHNEVDDNFFLIDTGDKKIDKSIHKVNKMISEMNDEWIANNDFLKQKYLESKAQHVNHKPKKIKFLSFFFKKKAN